MPKIRRRKIPEPLLNHLYDRIQDRKISYDQLGLFATWLETEPDVPIGKWFKQFPGMFVCGEGEFVKTFLQPGQLPDGLEINEPWLLGGAFTLRLRQKLLTKGVPFIQVFNGLNGCEGSARLSSVP